MSSVENTNSSYAVYGSLALNILPILASEWGENKILQGKLFIKHGEYKTFIEQYKSDLDQVDVTICQSWRGLMEDPQGVIKSGTIDPSRLIRVSDNTSFSPPCRNFFSYWIDS